MRFIFTFSLLIVILLSFSGCNINQIAADPPAGLIPDFVPPTGEAQSLLAHTGRVLHGHMLVAENDFYALYLNESTLGIIIRDVVTGAYMRSTVAEADEADNAMWQGLYLSGVSLDIQTGLNVHLTRADLVNTNRSLNIRFREDGFSAQVYFPEFQIGYTLIVTLTDVGFTAEIPQASIHEGDPNLTVGSFYVFPFLGYTRLGDEEGYMVIPDGQGALISLDYNEGRLATPFNEPVFGRNVGLEGDTMLAAFQGFSFMNDVEQVLMPVFGMVHTDREIGFLGVISSGAENAFIEAWPNGVSTSFNWTSARFVYRHLFSQPTGMTSSVIATRTPRPNRIDIKLSFLFVGGDQANYTGLALRYREYLAVNGAFNSAVMDDFSIGLTFLGSEQREWALFRLNVNMTTFEQAEYILRDLASEGVTGINVRFDGWARGGSTLSLPIRGFNPAGNLGGRNDLVRLRDAAEELGGQLTLLVDPLSIYTWAQPIESLNGMRRVTGRTADFFVPNGTMRLATPSRVVELSERTATALNENGFVADVTGIANFLTSYSEDNTFFCRTDSAVMFDYAVSMFDAPVLTRPNANLWQYGRALVDMPLRGSGYLSVYREIPFLSIVTSGKIPVYLEYVNFHPNQRRFFLNLVETGARPMFMITEVDPAYLRLTNRNDVYSSEYSLYRARIIRYHNELSALHAYIAGANIIGHEADGHLVQVTYDNGVRIYINYGSTDAVINGIAVEAMSYVVRRG